MGATPTCRADLGLHSDHRLNPIPGTVFNKNSPLFRSKKGLVSLLLIVFVLLPAYLFALYFEFFVDHSPTRAIAFFKHETNLAPRRNGANALIGLSAPESVKDTVQWAIQRSQYLSRITNWSQYDDAVAFQSSMQAIPQLFRNEAEVSRPGDRLHFFCWLPGGEKSTNNCVAEEELDSLFAENQIFLERYRKAIQYEEFDLTRTRALNSNTIELSEQFTARIWKNRQNFTQQDLLEISRLLWFWKRVVDTQNLSQVNFAVGLVNYGLALSLFFDTALLYPQIVDIFYQQYGEFTVHTTDQSLYDRLTTGEFYHVAPYICMDQEGAFHTTNCPDLMPLLFKPGRTMDLMYRGRNQFANCAGGPGEDGDYPDSRLIPFQMRTWARLGNYQGRITVFELYNSFQNNCEIQRNYKYKNELIAFFGFYHTIKSQNLSHAEILQKSNDRDAAFRIPYSERYFSWQQDSNSLVYIRPDSNGEVQYALPIEENPN